VQGSGCRVQGSGCRVQGARFRVQGSGFRVQGSEFRVQGSEIPLWGPCAQRPATGSLRTRSPQPQGVLHPPVPSARHVTSVWVSIRVKYGSHPRMSSAMVGIPNRSLLPSLPSVRVRARARRGPLERKTFVLEMQKPRPDSGHAWLICPLFTRQHFRRLAEEEKPS
jgi:hypothetical protein